MLQYPSSSSRDPSPPPPVRLFQPICRHTPGIPTDAYGFTAIIAPSLPTPHRPINLPQRHSSLPLARRHRSSPGLNPHSPRAAPPAPPSSRRRGASTSSLQARGMPPTSSTSFTPSTSPSSAHVGVLLHDGTDPFRARSSISHQGQSPAVVAATASQPQSAVNTLGHHRLAHKDSFGGSVMAGQRSSHVATSSGNSERSSLASDREAGNVANTSLSGPPSSYGAVTSRPTASAFHTNDSSGLGSALGEGESDRPMRPDLMRDATDTSIRFDNTNDADALEAEDLDQAAGSSFEQTYSDDPSSATLGRNAGIAAAAAAAAAATSSSTGANLRGVPSAETATISEEEREYLASPLAELSAFRPRRSAADVRGDVAASMAQQEISGGNDPQVSRIDTNGTSSPHPVPPASLSPSATLSAASASSVSDTSAGPNAEAEAIAPPSSPMIAIRPDLSTDDANRNPASEARSLSRPSTANVASSATLSPTSARPRTAGASSSSGSKLSADRSTAGGPGISRSNTAAATPASTTATNASSSSAQSRALRPSTRVFPQLPSAPGLAPAPPPAMYWSRAPAHGSVPRRAFRAHTANLADEVLWLFGGCDSKGCFRELWCFDTETMCWSKPKVSGDLPPPRRAHSATMVDKRLFVFAGGDGPHYFNDLFVFDTISLRWSRPEVYGTPPSPRRAHTSNYYEGQLVIFGGGNGVGALNDVHTLDITDLDRLEWKKVDCKGKIPIGRGYHTSNLVDGKLIVIGGSDGHMSFNDIHILRLDTKMWYQVKTDEIHNRLGHTATQVGSYLFVVGGHDSQSYTPEILTLNLVNLQWEPRRVCGRKPPGRGYHQAWLRDSRLFIHGGFDGKEIYNDLYFVDLAACAYLPQITSFSVELDDE